MGTGSDDGSTPQPAPWEEATAVRKPGREPGASSRSLRGTRVGDYVFGELLGEGGMGEVYAAEQPLIGKKVAIKVLREEIASDQGNVKRMLAEARAVNAVRHRGIVDISNFGNLPDGRPYLVMEYLVGEPLDRRLARKGHFQPGEACEILLQIVSALGAAHSAGVVHRDLKPANVFMVLEGSSSYVKLVDFGLAKSQQMLTSGPLTHTGMVVGTPDYIAPEQARGEGVTGQTDFYSLGVMAFELLTGQVPFKSESVLELMMQHVSAVPPRASTLVRGLPAALDDLVFSMMAKAPADRPASADEVKSQLKRALAQLREGKTQVRASAPRPSRPRAAPQPLVPPPAPAPAPSTVEVTQVGGPPRSDTTTDLTAPTLKPRSSPLWWAAGAVAVGAAGVVGWLVLSGPAPAPSLKEPSPPPALAEVAPVPAEPGPTAAPAVTPPPPVAAAVRPARGPSPSAKTEAPAASAIARGSSTPPRARLGGPTREELVAELERAIKKARSGPMSPKLVDNISDRLTRQIDAAKTPEDRSRTQQDIRDFEHSVAPAGHQ